MFLFIGVVMAAVQGGYVRRIAPGKEKARHINNLLSKPSERSERGLGIKNQQLATCMIRVRGRQE